MKIAILPSARSPLSTVYGPQEILELGLQLAGKPGRVTVLPVDFEPATTSEGYDLVLIAALGMLSEHRQVSLEPDVREWLIYQYRQQAAVAAICTGAFLLAETGLLNGKQASTHWLMAPLFRARYPSVRLMIEKMVTEQDGLWCSGGAFAYQDLCLGLIRHSLGQSVAEQCSRLLVLEPDRTSQQPFIDLQRYRQHNDTKVLAVQDHLEAHWHSGPPVAGLADRYAISERQLLRRFKSATGVSPSQYLQFLRIEHAKQLFREDPYRAVDAVANAVGYDDVGYFRKVFRLQVNVGPREFRDTYR